MIKETDWNELKMAINNAIWMHAPGHLTLAQAEQCAVSVVSMIAELANKAEESK